MTLKLLGRRSLLWAPALIIVGAIPVIAGAADMILAAAEQGEQVVNATTLATGVIGETDRLAPTSSVADYEASIMFIVSQSGADDETILAALDIVDARPALPETLKVAIENIRRTLRKKKLTRGTGALGEGTSSSFSVPSIGIGGGSTNYTQ
ncbi:hypothetical protein [Sphingobium aromaticiconvertens]|uniref:hypothetical protein n=1 Tax=Sphingobium aromaticiconvertens TaxID=365341 RepID=UPI0030179D80